MELRHLRSFLALADELHFGRAAERIGIAQPPLSRHIQQLEAEVGVRLVERNPRGVRLTVAGKAFRDRIGPHLAGIADATAEVRAVAAGLRGRLVAGYLGNLSYVLLPSVLERLRAELPDAVFDLREIAAGDAEDAVRSRGLDVALTVLPLRDQGLMRRVLREERLVVALPAGHRLAARSELEVSEIRDEPFVMCARYQRSYFQHVIARRCDEVGFKPKVVQEAGGKALLVELVASGVGLSLAPESSSRSGRPGVVYRPIAEAIRPLTFAAVWHPDNGNPLRKPFLDAVVATSKTLSGSEAPESGRAAAAV